MRNPARWLANGLINAYWRNKSGIEDIHAGEWETHPLLQRHITPMPEYTIVLKLLDFSYYTFGNEVHQVEVLLSAKILAILRHGFLLATGTPTSAVVSQERAWKILHIYNTCAIV